MLTLLTILFVLIATVACRNFQRFDDRRYADENQRREVNEDFCMDRVNGLYPHPEKCGSYIKCYKKVAFTESCPGNLLFNMNSELCDDPQFVDCEREQYPCTVRPNGIYPHPRSCDLYIVCIDKMLYVKECDRNLAFDAKNKKCDHYAFVGCKYQ